MKNFYGSSEKLRFVIFGVANTFLGWLVFIIFQFILAGRYSYIYSLIAAYVIGTFTSFLLQKYFVFRANNKTKWEFLRFSIVYIPQLIVNILLLPNIASILNINLIIAQTVFVIIASVASYLGHKFFTFRK